jgi:polysaccharide export outer membrane protein
MNTRSASSALSRGQLFPVALMFLALATADAPAAPPRKDPPPRPPAPTPEAGASVAPEKMQEPRTTEHRLGPEDLLEISVFEVPQLNRTVRVTEGGTISLPLLGEMAVRGLTVSQLETNLREALARGYVEDPQVSVFVKEYRSRKVSVIGAVGAPGVYEILGPRTLLEVLSQAGGLTERSGGKIYILRNTKEGGEQRIAVNVADLMENRDQSLNVPIEPGDIISIPIDRPAYVYVDGAVRTPGRIEQLASRPLSLLQAIARAGGPTDRADLRNVQVLRRGEDGEQTLIEVNLKKVRKGEEPDPTLRDGDIVVVRETFF